MVERALQADIPGRRTNKNVILAVLCHPTVEGHVVIGQVTLCKGQSDTFGLAGVSPTLATFSSSLMGLGTVETGGALDIDTVGAVGKVLPLDPYTRNGGGWPWRRHLLTVRLFF
jgi:hypothetical protein